MTQKKVLIFVFFTAFLILGIVSMQRAMPPAKEARIYKALHVYSPYEMEKRIGGLEILDKRDKTKEKPSSQEVLFRFDEVEGQWGKEHFKIEGNEISISDEKNQTVGKVLIQTEKERAFVKRFYGI